MAVADWYMNKAYVVELQALSARPVIRVPAVLIHGRKDSDKGGSALFRIQEWADKEHFARRFWPDEGHSLDIVGAKRSLSWGNLAHWAVRGEAVVLPYYADSIDGNVGALTAYALQRFLADQGFFDPKDIDSDWGDETTKRFQEFLKKRGFPGPIDGKLRDGTDTTASTKACQRWLSWVGHPPVAGVDGKWGRRTVEALQGFLAQFTLPAA